MPTPNERKQALIRFLNGAKNEGITDVVFTASSVLENRNQRAVLARELMVAIEWNDGRVVTGGWIIRYAASMKRILYFQAEPYDENQEIDSNIEGYLESPDKRQMVKEIIEVMEL